MQSPASRIVVLGTGGTIAGWSASAADGVGYRAGAVAVQDLLARVGDGLPATLESEQVAQLDSKDVDGATWCQLARRIDHHLRRPDVGAVVVTHGTDTLEETAWLLHRVLGPTRPVVLTAAMRPASALLSDGPQNLRDALVLAAEPGAAGVLVALAGQVHGAEDVRKLHSYRVDAFGSGDAGPLASIAEGRVQAWRPWPRPMPLGVDVLTEPADDWPWVEIVTSHAGAHGRAVDAWVDAGVQGLVVAGTGNGSVHHRLEAALRRAIERGVVVHRVSRCAFGPVIASGDEVGLVSPVQGAAKARVELLLQLLCRR